MVETLRLKLKSQKGFTLIELLAVIVILGILAAIAIPSITNVINNTKDKAKVAEALQLIDAARLSYADDSSKTHWKNAIPTGNTDTTLGDLSSYVSKVDFTGYEVIYTPSTKEYTIVHPAAAVIEGTSSDGTVTEKQLSDKAK